MTKEEKRKQWHDCFVSLMSKSLTPVGINVRSNTTIKTKTDLILQPSTGNQFTPTQRLNLADGLNDTDASRLIIEFKYTESFNIDALNQILGYLHGYFRSSEMKKKNRNIVAAFLLSAKTPKLTSLQYFGYQPSNKKGVYYTKDKRYHEITLLVLNQLSDEPHNLALKCFASRKFVVQKVYELIKQPDKHHFNYTALVAVHGLLELILKGKLDMNEQIITPDYLERVGKEVLQRAMKEMPIEDRLHGLDTQTVMQNFKTDERLHGLDTQTVMQNFKTDERLQGLSAQSIQQYLDNIKKRTYH